MDGRFSVCRECSVKCSEKTRVFFQTVLNNMRW
uniref:Uncharacterized protein n=1 Tax=Anopheles dirus TaxID=7168 RepID=A0A182NX44_9DIPT